MGQESYAGVVMQLSDRAADASRFEIRHRPVGGVFEWFVEEVTGARAVRVEIHDRRSGLRASAVGASMEEATARAFRALEQLQQKSTKP